MLFLDSSKAGIAMAALHHTQKLACPVRPSVPLGGCLEAVLGKFFRLAGRCEQLFGFLGGFFIVFQGKPRVVPAFQEDFV